uniref:30S ribosomal protein S24e n=1 Tax=Ignisphaera aggregans TaxID=334771 RepID=A0A7C2Z9M3_9CREN
MSIAGLEQKLGQRGKIIKLDENTVLTVVNEAINKALRRLELDVSIEHVFSGTPSRAAIKSAIAKLYGVSDEVVIVRNVVTKYGVGVSSAHIHIYADADFMKKVEVRPILKRNGLQA